MKKLIATYRALLVKTESLAGVDQAVDLVQRVFGSRIVQKNGKFELHRIGRHPPPADLSKPTCLPEKIDSSWIEKLARVRENPRRTDGRLRQRVLDTSVALTVVPALAAAVQAEFSAERHSLLLDSCMVLFHQAYFALLPELSGADSRDERNLLLEAFRRFVDFIPPTGDQSSLLALFHDAVGDYARAAECYLQALRTTPADADEFMTLLQTGWSFLIEHERYSDALDLLLENYPRVSRRDLDEMHELIARTFELQRRHYESLLAGARG